MQNAQKASQVICAKAKDLGIPLEVNFGGISKGTVMQDGQFAYPYSEFWQVAADSGVSVLYGVDAHTPEQFMSMEKSKEKADMIVDPTKLNLVNKNYNPVEARKNNKRLLELYEQSQAKALTYETNLISQITSEIINKIPDEKFSSETFSYMSEYALENIAKGSTEKASERDKATLSRIETISGDSNLPPEEKTFQLNRAENSIDHTNDTLAKQQLALQRARESIRTSVETGCKNKEDFKTSITRLTEEKTKQNGEKSNSIIDNTVNNNKQVKGPVLVKKMNNDKNNPNGNKGYINIIALSLIITFACGIAVGIGYMLYKISIG